MKKEKLQPEEELQRAFDRWDELYAFGGHDPFWSDGCNLNLVRNHIRYYKKKSKKPISLKTIRPYITGKRRRKSRRTI